MDWKPLVTDNVESQHIRCHELHEGDELSMLVANFKAQHAKAVILINTQDNYFIAPRFLEGRVHGLISALVYAVYIIIVRPWEWTCMWHEMHDWIPLSYSLIAILWAYPPLLSYDHPNHLFYEIWPLNVCDQSTDYKYWYVIYILILKKWSNNCWGHMVQRNSGCMASVVPGSSTDN